MESAECVAPSWLPSVSCAATSPLTRGGRDMGINKKELPIPGSSFAFIWSCAIGR